MSIVDVVQRTAVRRGVFGTSRAWLAVAIGTWSLRQARRIASRRETAVLTEELRPGESLLITHTTDTYG
jgi:hypothetical protein